ncbi:MAG TPA: hypothetical protein V6D15_16245 [Oculatellaceae cyanobacterium]|jgi:hypothetical protein
MLFSCSYIKEIEVYYNIVLPLEYKKAFYLIGDKIMNISSKSLSKDTPSLSVYEIQKEVNINDDDGSRDEPYLTDRLTNVFFITTFIKYVKDDDFLTAAYFIDPQEEDCAVYAWIYDNGYDTSSIEKISDNIEEWLKRIDPLLYFELQLKKLVCDTPYN